MTGQNFRRILTAFLLTAFLGPMANSAPSVQLALIPNHSTEVKELILEAFLFPDDYRERIAEYCSNLTGLPTGIPVPLTAQSLKPSTPQARTVKTEYETLIKAPNPQQGKTSGAAPKMPNPTIVDQMKRLQESDGFDSLDCSDIASRLKMYAGVGKIMSLEMPGNSRLLNPKLNLKVPEGEKIENYAYHQVYTDGNFIYDPRMSLQPMPVQSYTQLMKGLNPGVEIKVGDF